MKNILLMTVVLGLSTTNANAQFVDSTIPSLPGWTKYNLVMNLMVLLLIKTIGGCMVILQSTIQMNSMAIMKSKEWRKFIVTKW